MHSICTEGFSVGSCMHALITMQPFVLMTSDANASHRETHLCAHLVQRQTVLPALYHSEEGSTLLDQCYA